MARYLDPKNDLTFLPDELAENEQILKAAELCEMGAFTPEELARYEAYWDMVRTEKTIREGSVAKGRAEGRAEGRIEGRAEGEANTQRKVIENGHCAGIPIEIISTMTGLTTEEVIKIIEEL